MADEPDLTNRLLDAATPFCMPFIERHEEGREPYVILHVKADDIYRLREIVGWDIEDIGVTETNPALTAARTEAAKENTIEAMWDADARVWFTRETTIAGLTVEAPTMGAFFDAACDAGIELLPDTENIPAIKVIFLGPIPYVQDEGLAQTAVSPHSEASADTWRESQTESQAQDGPNGRDFLESTTEPLAEWLHNMFDQDETEWKDWTEKRRNEYRDAARRLLEQPFMLPSPPVSQQEKREA